MRSADFVLNFDNNMESTTLASRMAARMNSAERMLQEIEYFKSENKHKIMKQNLHKMVHIIE